MIEPPCGGYVVTASLCRNLLISVQTEVTEDLGRGSGRVSRRPGTGNLAGFIAAARRRWPDRFSRNLKETGS